MQVLIHVLTFLPMIHLTSAESKQHSQRKLQIHEKKDMCWWTSLLPQSTSSSPLHTYQFKESVVFWFFTLLSKQWTLCSRRPNDIMETEMTSRNRIWSEKPLQFTFLVLPSIYNQETLWSQPSTLASTEDGCPHKCSCLIFAENPVDDDEDSEDILDCQKLGYCQYASSSLYGKENQKGLKEIIQQKQHQFGQQSWSSVLPKTRKWVNNNSFIGQNQ